MGKILKSVATINLYTVRPVKQVGSKVASVTKDVVHSVSAESDKLNRQREIKRQAKHLAEVTKAKIAEQPSTASA